MPNICGNCAFGKVTPVNMKQRMCFGMPPQVLMFPPTRANEQFELRALRPVVSADDMACSCFVLDSFKAQANENPVATGGERKQ